MPTPQISLLQTLVYIASGCTLSVDQRKWRVSYSGQFVAATRLCQLMQIPQTSPLYCWLNIKCTLQVLTRRKWRVGINYVSQLAFLQDHLDANTALCSLGSSVEVHILDTEHSHAQIEIIMPLLKLRLFTVLSKRVSSYFIWWKSLSDFMKLLQMTRLGGRHAQPWSSATDVIWPGWG